MGTVYRWQSIHCTFKAISEIYHHVNPTSTESCHCPRLNTGPIHLQQVKGEFSERNWADNHNRPCFGQDVLAFTKCSVIYIETQCPLSIDPYSTSQISLRYPIILANRRLILSIKSACFPLAVVRVHLQLSRSPTTCNFKARVIFQ